MLRVLLWLPLLTCACASSEPHPQHPLTDDSDPSHDGSSCQRAIVVDAQDEWSGALQEQMALQRVPGLKVLGQGLSVCDGKHIDIFKVHTPEGTTQVYFDISRYYGRHQK